MLVVCFLICCFDFQMLDYENSILQFAVATTHCFVGHMMELHWCLDLKIVDLHYHHLYCSCLFDLKIVDVHYYYLYCSCYLDLKLDILIVVDLCLPTMFGIYIIVAHINFTLSTWWLWNYFSYIYMCVSFLSCNITCDTQKATIQLRCNGDQLFLHSSFCFFEPKAYPESTYKLLTQLFTISLFTMFDSSYLESIYIYSILQNILRGRIKFGNFGYLIEKSFFDDFPL